MDKRFVYFTCHNAITLILEIQRCMNKSICIIIYNYALVAKQKQMGFT